MAMPFRGTIDLIAEENRYLVANQVVSKALLDAPNFSMRGTSLRAQGIQPTISRVTINS